MLLETILGGITGLVGNVVSSVYNYKTRKLEMEKDRMNNEHSVNMLRAKTEADIAKSKAEIKVTQAQVEGATALKDSEAYIESQKASQKEYFGTEWIKSLMNVEGKWRIVTFPIAVFVAFLFGMLDFLRGIMRPTLTLYLTIVTSWLTWKAWEVMQMHGDKLSGFQAVEIFSTTTSIVVYLTVSCVTWWFGDRRMSKTIMEMRGANKTTLDDDVNL